MQFLIVDVFAVGQYSGNQLAVIVGNYNASTMQQLALEMNYSETTFITSTAPINGGYDVRIFTPKNELPFAGHPTLGTATVIRDLLEPDASQIILNLKVGQIPVDFGDDGVAWMQQKPPQFGHIYDAAEVAAALGVKESDIDTRFPVQEVSTGLPFIIAPLKTLDAVKRASVHLPKFMRMINAGRHHLGADAIYVFAPQTIDSANDLHARCFLHLHGIPEDPATGSANGCFAAWLSKHEYFGTPIVKSRVEQGYQVRRPSLILLDAHQTDDKTISVRVGGRVVNVAKGELVQEMG
jgi:trans-2,3-dihydro-3-hydroxyanthranilate isomerase